MTHLTFQKDAEYKGKTHKWEVSSTHKDCDAIGIIYWHSGWRQYVLEPYDSIWSWDCLKEVSDFIKAEMDKRRK